MDPTPTSKLRPRLKTASLWALALVVALAFLGAGLPKLLGVDSPGGSAADFDRWGYPAWFRTVVGAGETLGAILLLLPRPLVLGAPPRFWGALGLSVDMLGAIGTHLTHAEAAMTAFPATLLVLAAALAVVSRPARRVRPPARATAAQGDAP